MFADVFQKYKLCRSSLRMCYVKKCVLKSFANFTGKHMHCSLFLIRLKTCNFIKRRLQHRCFPVKFAKILRTPILENICERLLLIAEMFRKFSGKQPSEPFLRLTLQLCPKKYSIMMIFLRILWNFLGHFLKWTSGDFCSWANRLVTINKMEAYKGILNPITLKVTHFSTIVNGLTLFRMGDQKRPSTSCFPVTSTSVRISPENFLAFSLNSFVTLV